MTHLIAQSEIMGHSAKIMSDIHARNALVTANMNLVRHFAKRCRNRGLEYEDVLQLGAIGLMRAAEKFEASRGLAFSTYAMYWIRAEVERGIANLARGIRLPSWISEVTGRCHRFVTRFEVKHGRPPTREEISKGLALAVPDGTEADKVEAPSPSKRGMRTLTRVILAEDLPQCYGREGGTLDDPELWDGGKDPEADIEQIAERNEDERRIADIVSSLPARERIIVLGRIDDPQRSFEDIGRELNLTRERVRQISEKVLREVHAAYIEGRRSIAGAPSADRAWVGSGAVARRRAETEREALEFVRAFGPCTSRDVARGINRSFQMTKKAMEALVSGGEVMIEDKWFYRVACSAERS